MARCSGQVGKTEGIWHCQNSQLCRKEENVQPDEKMSNQMNRNHRKPRGSPAMTAGGQDRRGSVLKAEHELCKELEELELRFSKLSLLLDSAASHEVGTAGSMQSESEYRPLVTSARTPAGPHIDNLEDHIKSIEEELAALGDDTQLATLDLQKVMEEQQRMLQVLSSINKMMYDTAITIIRNIKS